MAITYSANNNLLAPDTGQLSAAGQATLGAVTYWNPRKAEKGRQHESPENGKLTDDF